MKKEEIYVEINNEAEQKRAIEILQKAGEKIYEGSRLLKIGCVGNLTLDTSWNFPSFNHPIERQQITLDQLEQLLTPSIDKEIEDFKERMKELGFEISVVIEKEVIKPDDVVMYFDDNDINKSFIRYGNLLGSWDNIVKVTDEHVLKFLGL